MTHLDFARMQMAFSLGFHIVFASISMIMPWFMVRALYKFQKTGDNDYQRLSAAWAKGVAILFATGAVSGTALSFQLGLLWPEFMKHAGPVIGMPFSLEGGAFFLEAIFLGIFFYGKSRLSPRWHLASGIGVALSGLASAVLVLAANGWMNSPSGMTWTVNGPVDIDPVAALFNKAWPLQALHMVVAAFQATGFAAAGIHALGILRGKHVEVHKKALRIILPFVVVASLIQPLMGDLSAKSVAQRQPEKLAAMEAHFHTEKGASLYIGGLPDVENQTVKYGIAIPKALSFLAFGDFNAEVKGLNEFLEDERPPVVITHLAFQVMVAIGSLLMAVASLWLLAKFKFKHWLESDWFYKILVFCLPLGFVALEAGWIVTEVGRQPWIIYKVMKTADSVTPVPGLEVAFAFVVVLYTVLGLFSTVLLRRIFSHALVSAKPMEGLDKNEGIEVAFVNGSNKEGRHG